MVRWSAVVATVLCVVFLQGLIVAPVAAGEGTHAGAPFVFAPVIDDEWRAAAAAIAAGLPWQSPLVPGVNSVRTADDPGGVRLSYTLGSPERESIVLPVAATAHNVYGVAPEDLPATLVLAGARHHMGWSSNTKMASVTAFAAPGTFEALGSGAMGVVAVAAAMGIPIPATGEGHEIEETRFEVRDWRSTVEFRAPPDGMVLFQGSFPDVVVHCTCTQVIVSTPLLGDTVNRIVGLYDDDGEVFLVQVTPWVNQAEIDFGDTAQMEAAALQWLNETRGHAPDALSARFQGYGLHPVGDRMLAFAGFVSVEARLGFMEKAHHTVAVDPMTGDALGTSGLFETSHMPALGALGVLVAVVAAGALQVARAGGRRLT